MNSSDQVCTRQRYLGQGEGSIRFSLVYDPEDAGFRVINAKDADAATSLIESWTDIAALVTDIGMPGSVDGMGTCALEAGATRYCGPGRPVLLLLA